VLALADDELLFELGRVPIEGIRRARVLFGDVLERNMRELGSYAQRHPPLQFAYSVKTNPDWRVLRAALAAGLYAEVIGPQELDKTERAGFAGRTIYNGPVPAWRNGGVAPGIVFSDSIEAYLTNAERLPATLVGVRIRPDGISSRFGVPRDRFEELASAVRTSGRAQCAVSFHVRPQDFGERSWRDVAGSAIEAAAWLERATGCEVIVFDVGGGKTPAEFDAAVLAGDFEWATARATAALRNLRMLVAEPGQAIVTPVSAVIAPVLEIRREGAQRAIVVDAGYPDLPQIRTFAHRLVALFAGEATLLPPGNDRVLGCTCLEYDVIGEGVRLPARLDRLHAVAIADTGAYDWSMGFDFARGGNNGFNDGIDAHASELHSSDSLEYDATR
jgi:diaminopimelate decarboxylase